MSKPNLFLANWADVLGYDEPKESLSYDDLIDSDDEFLCLESLFVDADTFEAGL